MIPARETFEPFSLLRTEMDRLFDNYLGQSSPLSGAQAVSHQRRSAYPAFNVWENTESFYVEAECPGLDLGAIELSMAGNQLLVSGERKEEYPPGTAFHRQERGTGRFSRTVTLPAEVDAEKVDATLKDGVLTIQLPKAASAKPRRIEINI